MIQDELTFDDQDFGGGSGGSGTTDPIFDPDTPTIEDSNITGSNTDDDSDILNTDWSQYETCSVFEDPDPIITSTSSGERRYLCYAPEAPYTLHGDDTDITFSNWRFVRTDEYEDKLVYLYSLDIKSSKDINFAWESPIRVYSTDIFRWPMPGYFEQAGYSYDMFGFANHGDYIIEDSGRLSATYSYKPGSQFNINNLKSTYTQNRAEFDLDIVAPLKANISSRLYYYFVIDKSKLDLYIENSDSASAVIRNYNKNLLSDLMINGDHFGFNVYSCYHDNEKFLCNYHNESYFEWRDFRQKRTIVDYNGELEHMVYSRTNHSPYRFFKPNIEQIHISDYKSYSPKPKSEITPYAYHGSGGVRVGIKNEITGLNPLAVETPSIQIDFDVNFYHKKQILRKSVHVEEFLTFSYSKQGDLYGEYIHDRCIDDLGMEIGVDIDALDIRDYEIRIENFKVSHENNNFVYDANYETGPFEIDCVLMKDEISEGSVDSHPMSIITPDPIGPGDPTNDGFLEDKEFPSTLM